MGQRLSRWRMQFNWEKNGNTSSHWQYFGVLCWGRWHWGGRHDWFVSPLSIFGYCHRILLFPPKQLGWGSSKLKKNISIWLLQRRLSTCASLQNPLQFSIVPFIFFSAKKNERKKKDSFSFVFVFKTWKWWLYDNGSNCGRRWMEHEGKSSTRGIFFLLSLVKCQSRREMCGRQAGREGGSRSTVTPANCVQTR